MHEETLFHCFAQSIHRVIVECVQDKKGIQTGSKLRSRNRCRQSLELVTFKLFTEISAIVVFALTNPVRHISISS